MNNYKIIRSKRKTLAIQVTDKCEIIVRAPYLCSAQKIQKFVETNSDWIDKALNKQEKAADNKINLSENDISNLKILAKEVLPQRVEYYSEIMGVKPESIKITSAQKRFGSCSGKNNICFSYMVMLYPTESIDYVVVHELAHIVHHNHSKAFYSLVESVLPDYKKREKMLKSEQTLPF